LSSKTGVNDATFRVYAKRGASYASCRVMDSIQYRGGVSGAMGRIKAGPAVEGELPYRW
jgi:hypothetical protein